MISHSFYGVVFLCADSSIVGSGVAHADSVPISDNFMANDQWNGFTCWNKEERTLI